MLRPMLLLPTVAIVLSASAQEYTATVKTAVDRPENATWKKWSDKECAINYPTKWTNEGTMGAGALAVFFAPQDAASGFRERVHLARVEVDGRTPEQIRKSMESDDELGVTDMRDLASSAEGDKVTMEFTGTFDGQPVRVKRALIVRNDKAWVLSYLAAPDHFEEKLYLADAMLQSFETK
ncbi:MAG TPA: hypothetical protein PL002_16060 [Flavobacteriales bacterium]|nr:hypothetical protein [Flavobacteriales bacterium]